MSWLKKVGLWVKESIADVASVVTLTSGFRQQKKQIEFQSACQQNWMAFQEECRQRQLDMQVQMQERQLEHNRQMQERQMQYQTALQERNYQLMGNLQREMAVLKFEMDFAMQKWHFLKQEESWEKTHFIDKSWPLIDTPQAIVARLESMGQPLQVILSGSVENKFAGTLDNVADFFNSKYVGDSLVYYYNQGWKAAMSDRDGNAQRDAIHQAMAGLPTLLLLPKSADSEFQLRIAFWGWGNMALPQTRKIFAVNLKKLQSSILRDIALEWKGRPFPPNAVGRMKTIQDNLAVAKEEDEYRDSLRQMGSYSEEEVENLCFDAFYERYAYRGLEDDLLKAQNRILSAPLQITGAMISDGFNLGNGKLPLLPAILKDYPEDTREKFWPQIVQFFEASLQMRDELERPYAQALLAKAFAEAGYDEQAQIWQEEALKFLAKIYADQTKPFALEHWDAIQILRETAKAAERYPYLLKEAKGNSLPCLGITVKYVPKAADEKGLEEEFAPLLEEVQKTLLEYDMTAPRVVRQLEVLRAVCFRLVKVREENLALWERELEENRKEGIREDRPKMVELKERIARYRTFLKGYPRQNAPLDEMVKFVQMKVMKPGDRMVKTIGGVEYAFRWCPAGKFTMGGPREEWNGSSLVDKTDSHGVTFSKGFWMLETQVTQKMWKSVTGSNPSNFKGDKLPVECVSWDDCQDFCKKLRAKGLEVSLPTEAQWEYACRAGTTGDYAGNLDDMAWYDDNSGSKTHEVGLKKPNAWGLYDMHGNVWEWCQDWYGGYAKSPTSDPTGPASGSYRVDRGGSWISVAEGCRSANRYGDSPDCRSSNLGLRLVCGIQSGQGK